MQIDRKPDRIGITISPNIEEIFLQQKYKEVFVFFSNLLSFSKELNNSVMICLPFVFQHGFKNCSDSMIKTLYYQISLPNSNVFFSPDNNHCNLSFIDREKEDLVVDLSSIGLLTNFFMHYKKPLILDTVKRIYHKDECNNFECKNNPCLQTMEIETVDLADKNIFLANLKENCKQNLNEWIIYKNDIQISDFRNMFYFAAFSMNIEEQLYEKINEIEFLDEYILNDIKNEDAYVLKDIATSILRAYLYGPASDRKNKDQYSIDYHPNSPSEKDGYDLLRLDVIDIKYSGYKDNHSGSRRILIARRDNKKYVIAYVPDHEFSQNLIDSRMKVLESRI